MPTDFHSLEQKYGGLIHRVNGLLLLPAERVVQLLDDCEGAHFRVSVEAFRLYDDGGIQPAMRFSDPTPEECEQYGGVLAATRALVVDGSANGYAWYEVWLEDESTGEGLLVGESSGDRTSEDVVPAPEPGSPRPALFARQGGSGTARRAGDPGSSPG